MYNVDLCIISNSSSDVVNASLLAQRNVCFAVNKDGFELGKNTNIYLIDYYTDMIL